jgi:predicted signal transduction protein with EAL and GGDEF domain
VRQIAADPVPVRHIGPIQLPHASKEAGVPSERFKNFVKRHRYTIRDLSVLLAVMSVLAFIAFEVDLFEHEGGASTHELTIELDEALLLGGVLAVGLLIFATRRYFAQQREIQRRLLAEQEVRRIAFQDSLTGLPNRRQFDDVLKTALGSPPRADAQHGLLLLDLNGFKQVCTPAVLRNSEQP